MSKLKIKMLKSKPKSLPNSKRKLIKHNKMKKKIKRRRKSRFD